MKKLKIKTQFQVGAAAIILIFCASISIFFYYYLKDSVTKTVYEETEIFVQAADATRTYVKDVLRPRMNELLHPDAFIPEAMSTSYVGREIMSRIRERFPDFLYKRATGNPMNPINRADPFELQMLEWFRQHRQAGEWHGVIQKESKSFYSRLKPIYAEEDCLSCHGDPAEAPKAMTEIYGTDGGFHYQVGDVVAADTIYIPVDVSLARVKETAWMVFVLAICSLVFLMGLFHLLFNRTVVTELKDVLGSFRSISGHNRPFSEPPPRSGAVAVDEFEQIKEAFEKVADDLKQTHDHLKASESKYRLLFENSQETILIGDMQTRLTDINPAGIEMFGFRDRLEALSIETLYQLFWDTRDAEFFFQTIRERGFIQGLEVAMVDRSGRKLEALVSATVRAGDAGQPEAMEATIRDVTEKRRMEKYLAQTEKIASIGQLAAGVAHEINNPLGVITCYVNLVAKGLQPGSQMMKDVQTIQKHADHCKSIVEALLSFARVSEPKRVSTDIHACIDEVLSVLALQIEKSEIRVHRNFADNFPRLTVDAQQMKQVFMNLLINAVQAMPGQGDLTIRTSVDYSNKKVAIAISDTGAGISDKHLDRIFDPFFTTKAEGEGTGLGLSVSHGIVTRHGGTIEVASTPGASTQFTVYLPLDVVEGEEGV